MKLSDLKLSVEQIHMDEDLQQKIIEELTERYGENGVKRTPRQKGHNHRNAQGYHRFGKVAAAILIVGVALAGISVPVRALVNSLVAERMEEIPQEEVTAIVEQTDHQAVEADGYSREYTEGEKERRGELYEAYRKGTFPEGELVQVDTEEEAKQQEFCYLKTNSAFYLPADRELTDEEILQMIDFEEKRNYALRQRYEEENAEEIAAEKAEKEEQIAQVVSEGGITEQEAIRIATEYLQQMYGLDGSGMELNHYYEESMNAGTLSREKSNYGVNWSNNGSHQYYYFWIDAGNGDLSEFSYSDAEWDTREQAEPSVSEASARASAIKEQAVDFLENRIGITESYDKVDTCYRVYNGEEVGTFVYVVFYKSDQTAYVLTYHWDGTVINYNSTSADRWEERIEQEAEYIAQDLSEYRGEKVTVELIHQ
ncbi:MAG: hypothetical protein J6K48_14280 [Lachnospiraceae bacterium]|nr:hypothetical protein [Lachnospiraceae bacterium]